MLHNEVDLGSDCTSAWFLLIIQYLCLRIKACRKKKIQDMKNKSIIFFYKSNVQAKHVIHIIKIKYIVH